MLNLKYCYKLCYCIILGITDTFSESELLASESEPVELCNKRSSMSSLNDISPLKSHRASIAASDDFDLSGIFNYLKKIKNIPYKQYQI